MAGLDRSTNFRKEDLSGVTLFLWAKTMIKKTYYEKLKDPKWQKKRLEAMQRKEFCCELCGDNETTLNVHHKEYFKNYEPWEYELDQLAVLCESCHESYHDSLDALKWVCSYAPVDGPGNRNELAFLIAGYLNIGYEEILSISNIKKHLSNKELHDIGTQAYDYYFSDLAKHRKAKK